MPMTSSIWLYHWFAENFTANILFYRSSCSHAETSLSSWSCCHRREERSPVCSRTTWFTWVHADFMRLWGCVVFDDTEEGANWTRKLRALSNMDVIPETEKCHSRRRADITSSANNSVIFCRLTVTLVLLAEELRICSEACSGLILWMHVEWKHCAIFRAVWRGVTCTLAALWSVPCLLPFGRRWLACARGKQPVWSTSR